MGICIHASERHSALVLFQMKACIPSYLSLWAFFQTAYSVY